jgi:hypothetical protein
MKNFAIACLILLSTPSFAADLPCIGAACVDNPMFKPAPGGGGVKAQSRTPEPAEKPADAKSPSGANAKMK